MPCHFIKASYATAFYYDMVKKVSNIVQESPQMRMTGFAVVVVVDCLHDLILFMQHNIIMMMILYKPQSSIHTQNKLCAN